MIPIRSRRGKLIHATADCERTLCGKKCSGWALGDEKWEVIAKRGDACPACVDVSSTN